jgi:uncharacterized HAD superfamily protein
METYKPNRRICIDIDGCLCEYDFPSLVRNFFGVDLSPAAIFAYDLADVLGVSPALINTMFKAQVYGRPNLTVGAIDTLNEWRYNGYELVIFSNRVKYMGYDGLAQWLNKYQIPFSGIDGGQGKYDVHIDDSPAKLMSTDSEIKLLFDQPWNRKCHNITGKLIRMKNWEGIREYVQAYF